VAVSPTQYVYAAKNGALHRYGGATWTSGIYSKGVIMDRNLGAFSARAYATATARGQLYYQFGRKDPFPLLTCPIYVPAATGVAAGSVAVSKTVGGPGVPPPGISISTSLSMPLTYFVTPPNNTYARDWCSEEETPRRVWKDMYITSNITTSTLKSLFDPCPYGWQVPTSTTWSDFNFTSNSAATGVYGGSINTPSRGTAWDKDGVLGLRYWPGGAMAEAEIFYPPTGYYSATSSSVSDISLSSVISYVYLWANNPNTADVSSAYSIYSYKTGTSTNILSRLNGMPVRCVKVDVTAN